MQDGALNDDAVVSFLGRGCPSNVRRRTIVVSPGEALEVRRADWVDTLVVVEFGELDVECHDGTRARFGAGAILALDTPEPRRLRAATDTPLVLSALSRRRATSLRGSRSGAGVVAVGEDAGQPEAEERGQGIAEEQGGAHDGDRDAYPAENEGIALL